VFAGVFVIVWLGSGVVTINAQLLGGNISFLQSVCVLGYCIAPLALASLRPVMAHTAEQMELKQQAEAVRRKTEFAEAMQYVEDSRARLQAVQTEKREAQYRLRAAKAEPATGEAEIDQLEREIKLLEEREVMAQKELGAVTTMLVSSTRGMAKHDTAVTGQQHGTRTRHTTTQLGPTTPQQVDELRSHMCAYFCPFTFPVAGSVLAALIHQARPSLRAEELLQLTKNISARLHSDAASVASAGDVILVEDLIRKFENLPTRTTHHHLVEEGVVLGGPLLGHNLLYEAVKDESEFIVAKKLREDELPGHILLAQHEKELASHHIVPFHMFSYPSPVHTPVTTTTTSPIAASRTVAATGAPPSASFQLPRTPIKPLASAKPPPVQLKKWMYMPRYVQALEKYPRPLPPSRAQPLISQMLAALRFMHAQGIMHMDVKPANVFMDMQMNCWLGDFGSAAKEGATVWNVTVAFVPTDLRVPTDLKGRGAPYTASAKYDYWTLAVTVADMLAGPGEKEVGDGPVDLPTKVVKERLGRLSPQTAEVRELIGWLDRK